MGGLNALLRLTASCVRARFNTDCQKKAEAEVFQTAAESGNGVALFAICSLCLGHLCKNRVSRTPTVLRAAQVFPERVISRIIV